MLPQRQNAVLEYLRETREQSGMTPTIREIQSHFGYKSQTSVQDILKALVLKGLIQQIPGKARTWLATAQAALPRWAEIPIYGAIPAGLPTDEEQRDEGCVRVDLDTLKIRKNARTFALKVRGDSMMNAAITDGDIVIMEFKEAQNRDIVAALIDGDMTLKRYIVQRGRPYLKAENPKYKDLVPAHDLVIQGVMVALLRTAD